MSSRMRSFRAMSKRSRCRVCMFKKAAQTHHVVYEQELVRRGIDPWDLRNALAVCPRCHEMHHKRRSPIPLIMLHDINITYAFEILGAHAYDYLKARYAGDDERLESALEMAA